jgi:hypothetical protein
VSTVGKEIERIQSRCSCPCIEASRCFEWRYPNAEDHDDECECSCHAEIAELLYDEDAA